MTGARGVRLPWTALPPHVRAHVARVLDAPVIDAVSQASGFSPGSADRVVAANGRRAFVKAVSSAQNQESPRMHRRELHVTRALPPSAHTAQLLDGYDDGNWVALVLEDVAGQHPATPWRPEELHRVLGGVRALSQQLTPSPLPGAGSAAQRSHDDFGGWRRLRVAPGDDLDDWTRDHLDLLCRLAADALGVLVGDTLAHADLRADNILLREDGRPVVIDWPHACNAPEWLDTLLLLVNVHLHGGHDVETLVAQYCPDAEPHAVTAVLAGLAGYFLDAARLPDPAGLPTLREFQRAQGHSTLGWLRSRL